MTLVYDMGTHRRGRGLTMGTCYTESLMGLCQGAEHLCTFLDLKAILTEIAEFLMTLRNGWGINDKTSFLPFAGKRNLVDILFIVEEHTFFLQMPCQIRWCLVVSRHDKSLLQEITSNGTHAYATGSHEID